MRCASAAATVVLLWMALGAAPPTRAGSPTTTAQQQAQAQQKLAHVRAQIKALVARQRRTNGQRDSLHAGLAQQAQALQAAAQAVRASEAALAAKRAELNKLHVRLDVAQDRLDGQRGALAELLRATYALGPGSDLRLLLGELAGCPPAATPASAATAPAGHARACVSGSDALARIGRALAYSRYFQRDRLQQIRGLLADLSELKSLQASIATEQTAIQTTLDQRTGRVAALERQRTAQAKALAGAQAQWRAQGKQLESLKGDEQSLQRLIVQLRDVFADIPRTLPGETPFATLRGKLRWPLRGTVRSHHRGLLIAAKPGSAVHAVAHGRVVFANWLRGYGMLLIVDQGDGWMSLYGGNETLLREVGDWVNAGAVIATSGRGESGASGLYFGLRHDSKAVDPHGWLAPTR